MITVRRLPWAPLALAAAFVGTILAANAAVQHVEPAEIGPLQIPLEKTGKTVQDRSTRTRTTATPSWVGS